MTSPTPRTARLPLAVVLSLLGTPAAVTQSQVTDVQAQHAFSQSFDDPEQHFSGYSLVDATVTYALPRGALRMGVANLFDKQYITYYSQSALVEPLRYFAGRGRTLTPGYSLDF